MENRFTTSYQFSLYPGIIPSTASKYPVFIVTNGYILRTIHASDANPEFLGWLNSNEMKTGLNINIVDFDLPRLVDFINSFDSQSRYFIGIFEKEQGALLGFYTIDLNALHKVGTLTAGIGNEAFKRRDVFHVTIDALLDHFFAGGQIEKMVARVLARNWKMLFNLRDSLRFMVEANLKQECITPEGKRVDVVSFAAFKNPPAGYGIR